MSFDDFTPPPVPSSARALVLILKTRLQEAVENGKPGDAKTFLDIIERLAKMDWLDDTTVEERAARDNDVRTQDRVRLDKKLRAFIEANKEL